jgi:hypothetical protein
MAAVSFLLIFPIHLILILNNIGIFSMVIPNHIGILVMSIRIPNGIGILTCLFVFQTALVFWHIFMHIFIANGPGTFLYFGRLIIFETAMVFWYAYLYCKQH